MQTIRDLFARRVDRRIEEVIKVDQDDEETVLDELQEYVITEAISEHLTTVYKAIADAPSEPHEGIGIWVSGFFQADMLAAYLDVINANVPTHAIIFDVSMDRGVRTANERIAEIMYKALLRALDYAEDFDLADLEIGLEADGLLPRFHEEFQALHGRPWETRRKIGRGINEASAVLTKLDPATFSSADSWESRSGRGGPTSRRTCWRSEPSSWSVADALATH